MLRGGQTGIHETGSLQDASRVLHLTQPALSRAIKELEGELGITLLIRSNKGMTLTEYGQRMLGGPNLPMAIAELRRLAAPVAGPLRALAHARRVGAGATTTDIYVDDAHGNRVAEMIGVRNVAVAG